MSTSKEFYTKLTAEGLSNRKTASQTRSELSVLKKILNKKDKILDLACGYGRITIPLFRQGYNIDGIDITPSLINKAKKDALREKLNIKFRVGDMRKLPYKEKSFDKIICMWSAFLELSRKEDQIKAVREMYRALKDGGSVFLEMAPSLRRTSGKIVYKDKPEDEIIIKKYVTVGKMDGIERPVLYKHKKRTLENLLKKAKIKKYKIGEKEFGWRKRLLVQFWKIK